MKKLLLLTIMLVLSNVSFAQVALANEGFDGVDFPPAGWTVENTNATENWSSDGAIAFVNYIAEDQDESLITPSFSLAGFTSAYLNVTAVLGYEYMVNPNPNGDLLINVSTDGGSNWTQVWVEEDYGVFADYEPLLLHINLAAYLGQADVKVKFEYVANDADVVSIDNVSVTGCKTLDDIYLTALTDNTATIAWSNSSSSYDVEWGAQGFTQGAGTMSNNLTEASLNLTGLTAGSGYDYYVKSSCGGASNSGWEGPFTFYTTLSTAADLNYSFGFESPTLGSAGWSAPDSTVANTESWVASTVDETFAQDGTGIAACFGTQGLATNAWLFSRGLNLVGGTTITISYYVREYKTAGNGGTNNLVVKIGTNNTAAAQTTLIATNNNIGAATDAEDAYVLKTYTYIVPNTGVYYLGFNCTSASQTATNNGALLLDAVSVTGPLAVRNFLSNKFTVSPNPTKDLLSISSANNLISTIAIKDLNGRVVMQKGFNKVSQAQVNVAELATGVYMMSVTSDAGSFTKKIIKQ